MKIHFIGIGGIGVSALARYYKSIGSVVSGSDLVKSEITEELELEGINVFIGHHSKLHIKKDFNLVVFSAAIKEENPEIKKAKEFGIKTIKYSDALSEIAKDYFLICIAGSHGKSTTTSMLALILIKAGFNPTVIVGTKLKQFNNTNFRAGSKKAIKGLNKPIMLIEADEWQASFLSYKPNIVAITNIEEEHLDFYKNFEHIIKTYKQFINKINKNGVLVLSKTDIGSQILLSKLKDYKVEIKFYDELKEKTKGILMEEEIKKLLKVPGKHNLKNALVAKTIAEWLSISKNSISSGLKSYKGAWRRFDEKEIIVNGKKITIINDYAHHPTEIKATLEAVKEKYGDKVIWTIFQPHQQQRTQNLMEKFVNAFDLTNKLILTDIYEVTGRERQDVIITSNDLFVKIKRRWQKNNFSNESIGVIKDFKTIAELIKKKTKTGDLIIIMGAGNIWNLNQYL